MCGGSRNRLTSVLLLVTFTSMERIQANTVIPKGEAARFMAALKGRSIYAFTLEAIREKIQREERENR